MVPREPSAEDIALAATIERRRTDRRRFSSWPVPRDHLDAYRAALAALAASDMIRERT